MAQAAQKTQQTQAVAKTPKITNQVLGQIEKMRAMGRLRLPPDYEPAMALNNAWLILQDTKDRNSRPVLQSCTPGSIARCLFEMVYKGLNPAKAQAYFIAYGDQLTLLVGYQGHVAMAKRADPNIQDIVAQVVYSDDEIEVDVVNGYDVVTKHRKKPFAKHSIDDAIGAYANVIYKDGRIVSTVMTMDEVRHCWAVGKAQLNSPAHKQTPEEMVKRTVINRATKRIINTSSDADLFRDVEMEAAKAERDELIHSRTNVIDVDFEDAATAAPAAPLPAPETEAAAPETETEPEQPTIVAAAVNFETGEVFVDTNATVGPDTDEAETAGVPF